MSRAKSAWCLIAAATLMMPLASRAQTLRTLYSFAGFPAGELPNSALAKRLKKPQSFVSNFERGQRRIDILELIRIAKVINISPLKILGYIMAEFKG